MTEKLVKIIDPIGLHARPASLLVTIAKKYSENSIKLVLNNDKVVDAKSIINILSCAIEGNQEFIIRVDGIDSDTVLSEVIHSLTNLEILNEV